MTATLIFTFALLLVLGLAPALVLKLARDERPEALDHIPSWVGLPAADIESEAA